MRNAKYEIRFCVRIAVLRISIFAFRTFYVVVIRLPLGRLLFTFVGFGEDEQGDSKFYCDCGAIRFCAFSSLLCRTNG